LEPFKKQGFIKATEGSYSILQRIPSPDLFKLIPPSRGPVKITYWELRPLHEFQAAKTDLARNQFRKSFTSKNPHIYFEEFKRDHKMDNEKILLDQVLKNSSPTVAFTTQTKLPFLNENQVLASVDPVDAEMENYLDKVNPQYRKICSLPIGDSISKPSLAMLPNSVTYTYLFYNKFLFKRAGLDPERPPRDWDEFFTYAQKLSKENQKPSFYISSREALVLWLMLLTYQCLPMPAKTDILPPVDWMSKAAHAAISYMAKFFQNKLILMEHHLSLLASHMVVHEIPMFLNHAPVISSVRLGLVKQEELNERYAIAPMPVGRNGVSFSMANCNGMFINARAPKTEQEAALKYIYASASWLREGDGGEQFNQIGVIPPLISIFKDRSADRYAFNKLPSSWEKTIEDIQANGYWESHGADWKKKFLGEALSNILEKREAIIPEFLQEHLLVHEYHGGFLSHSGK
jgi:ABC-type glycerol-3-phosphate transport system substrate-binding protein